MGGFEMMRVIVSIVVLLAVNSAAAAQLKKAPPEKLSPRPVQPAPRVEPAPKAAPGAMTELSPFVYSPWTKFCGRDSNNPAAQPVCLTVREARLQTGQFVAGAALIEQVGEDKRLLRVTLPLGLRLMPGVQMFIDSEAARNGNYVICYPNGCMADFEVNPDFVARLKSGERLQLRGINAPGQVASYLLPLGGFAQANEGPPTDPATFEQEQRQRDAPPPVRPK
jgi:invasion protein IalB